MAKVKLSFIKRNGSTFTKSFKSITTAKRAIKGWTAAGGRMNRQSAGSRRQVARYRRTPF